MPVPAAPDRCPSGAIGDQLDSLTALLDSTVLSEGQIDLQLQIARSISNSDIRKALEYAHRALEDAEELRSTRWIAESKLAIGQFYDYLGVNKQAADHLVEAFSNFRVLGDSAKQALSLMSIGNAYYYLDQFETAQDYYNLVSEYGRALNDTSLIISGINATAAVFGNTGKMDSALILFNEALEPIQGNRQPSPGNPCLLQHRRCTSLFWPKDPGPEGVPCPGRQLRPENL
jgi:tetratricopeptide (TPR) repeat protein